MLKAERRSAGRLSYTITMRSIIPALVTLASTDAHAHNPAPDGCVGLNAPSFQAHFTPCVELAWRLAAPHWGQGYATEAARECLQLGFETLGLEEVVAFTVPHNARSLAVMQRLGVARDRCGDLDHPRLPPGRALSRHVLFRLCEASAARGLASQRALLQHSRRRKPSAASEVLAPQ